MVAQDRQVHGDQPGQLVVRAYLEKQVPLGQQVLLVP